MARCAVRDRLLTTIIQVLAGVGGLFLDIFFQKSMLDRKTTNTTKAVVQSLSHIVRAAYFGSVSGLRDVPLWACVPAIALAIAGTSLAPFVLERMTDHGFRRWSHVVIFAVSAVYLMRAAWLRSACPDRRSSPVPAPHCARDTGFHSIGICSSGALVGVCRCRGGCMMHHALVRSRTWIAA